MKTKPILFVLCLMLFAVVACKSPKSAASGNGLTDADVQLGASKYPGYTMTELAAGQHIYKTQCIACHPLKDPRNFSEEQLKRIVPGMSDMANKKAGAIVVTEQDRETLLRYLVVVGPMQSATPMN